MVIDRDAVTENVPPAAAPPSKLWRVPLAVSVIV